MTIHAQCLTILCLSIVNRVSHANASAAGQQCTAHVMVSVLCLIDAAVICQAMADMTRARMHVRHVVAVRPLVGARKRSAISQTCASTTCAEQALARRGTCTSTAKQAHGIGSNRGGTSGPLWRRSAAVALSGDERKHAHCVTGLQRSHVAPS